MGLTYLLRRENLSITCKSRAPVLLFSLYYFVSLPWESEREKEREMALRAAILRHVRVPVQTLIITGSKLQPRALYGGSLRFLSSHGDDHLTKDEVIDRVLSVVKSFPKVDPSKVCLCASHVLSDSLSFSVFSWKMSVWFPRICDQWEKNRAWCATAIDDFFSSVALINRKSPSIKFNSFAYLFIEAVDLPRIFFQM